MKTLKFLCIIIIVCFARTGARAQNIENKVSNDDWNNIITLLSNEKWVDAEKLSDKFLARYTDNDDSLAEPAILRYMNLRCVAARLSEHEYSKEKAMKKVEKFIGKTIITPPRPFYPKCIFNCLQLSENKKNLFSCSSNTDKTTIQIFETYIMADTNITKDTSALIDKKLRIGAIIKDIKTGGEMMPRFDITFGDAFIWDEE